MMTPVKQRLQEWSGVFALDYGDGTQREVVDTALVYPVALLIRCRISVHSIIFELNALPTVSSFCSRER